MQSLLVMVTAGFSQVLVVTELGVNSTQCTCETKNLFSRNVTLFFHYCVKITKQKRFKNNNLFG